jgi:superfamily II DNA or RNA helicase
MARLEDIVGGCAVSGLIPNQAVTVVSVEWFGNAVVQVTYRRWDGKVDETMLYRANEPRLSVAADHRPWAFDSPPDLFRLVSEARRIAWAAHFDPLLAVHTSLVQPLPHQIMAVYESMLSRQPLRFLLADDPGAGKTIMAGLLIKELMARGDLERCLVVAPGSLVEQWQDELEGKFALPFDILTNEGLEAARTGNWFREHPLAIARLDKLSRDEDVQRKLGDVEWDLIVVDEAHKMSANFFGGEINYTKRYKLGLALSRVCRHFLLMTATPHNGKEEDFQLFMALLDGDRFEGKPRDAVHSIDCSDMMRRLVKEQLLKFDGRPLFPERRAYSASYRLSDAEADLYAAVTEYVRTEFNRAEQLEANGRKGTVGFALTVLQRRLASSPAAIHSSLKRRREKLESLSREARIGARGEQSALLERLSAAVPTDGVLSDIENEDEVPSAELEAMEDAVSTDASAARTIEELQVEIEILKRLEAQGLAVCRSGVDRKWEELSRILQDTPEMFDSTGARRKLIIFTEHRDTLQYLEEKIGLLLGGRDSIVKIQGGMGRDQRRAAEESFKLDPLVQILLATDAAGEGLNLQRAHLMVNYDLPWNPNRIEQRFGRIHRIGQSEVCHLWNLIAHETREGDVYQKLLGKLELQRAALGGRVFDVLGRMFEGQSLRELLVDAVRYGDQPDVRARLEQAIDNATDQAHLRRLLDEHALARDSLDARKVQQIREDLERAEARRLQPYFILAFFLEAFVKLGGTLREREKGRFEVSHVPSLIRSRDRQVGHGPPVLHRYERITFEKELINVAGAPTAAFVCSGHPLLEAVLDLVLEQNSSLLRRGSVLVDDRNLTTSPRLLFYLEHVIKNAAHGAQGEAVVISREMQFVEIEDGGQARNPGYAPYLDYRPPTDAEAEMVRQVAGQAWLKADVEGLAKRFAIEHMVPEHIARVSKERRDRSERALRAIKQRLTAEIQYWDHRANELKAREAAGQSPKVNSASARQKADELATRMEARIRLIESEQHLAPAPPNIIGGTLIIPAQCLAALGDDVETTQNQHERERIDRLAMRAVIEAELALGRQPRELPHNNPGYDIESADPREPGRLRFLEVKGKAVGRDVVTVSVTQIRTALNKPDDWILAIVPVDGESAGKPRYVRRPFATAPEFAEVSRNLDLTQLLARSEDPS